MEPARATRLYLGLSAAVALAAAAAVLLPPLWHIAAVIALGAVAAGLLVRAQASLGALRQRAERLRTEGGIPLPQDAAPAELLEALHNRAQELDRERGRLLAVLGGMGEGVIAVDVEERVAHMNDAAARMLGVPADELVGRRLWARVRVSALVDTVRAALAERTGITGELRLPESGRDRFIDLHAAPLWSGTEQQRTLAGAVVVLHEVTELRRLEAVRRDFVSNVSHELKTPLTAIRGLLETVLDDAQMDAATRGDFLSRALAQSARLQALVSDLLTLSRVEAQDGGLESVELDLRRPLRAALSSLHHTAEARALQLEVSEPEAELTVLGDAEALRQAIGNLLDNALKYTPEGGQVWLRLFAQLGNAVVEVEDTGVGIPPEDLDRVFERFYRVDKARSRQVGGTGLGLSIVKHIALAHGGQVTVSSRAGTGSTFRLQLPLAR